MNELNELDSYISFFMILRSNTVHISPIFLCAATYLVYVYAETVVTMASLQ